MEIKKHYEDFKSGFNIILSSTKDIFDFLRNSILTGIPIALCNLACNKISEKSFEAILITIIFLIVSLFLLTINHYSFYIKIKNPVDEYKEKHDLSMLDIFKKNLFFTIPFLVLIIFILASTVTTILMSSNYTQVFHELFD